MNGHLDRRSLLAGGLAAGVAAPAFAQAKRAATFNWTLHKPEEVGMTRAGLDGVRAAIQNHIDKGDITGAVTAIARHNKLVHYEAQGVRDIETKAPMRKDDIFRMMSSTKPTVGVATLQLMEEGKLAIDDRVSRFIPEFHDAKVAVLPEDAEAQLRNPAMRAQLASQVKLVPATRDLTIKDLMTHTSGLSSGGAGQLVNRIRRGPNETLADYVPRLGSAALDFQPGARWRYSASDGIDVLLRIVEIASKTPADVALRERVFEPLNMRDTGFNIPPEKYGRILTLYSKQDGNWRPQRAAFGYGPIKYFSGAGGLMSTCHDYLQFEEMLLNKGELNGKRLLKPETVALMSTNHTGDLYRGTSGSTQGTGFGLTVRVLKDPAAANSGRLPGAFGWAGAYGTCSWTDPADDMTAALFIQQPVPTVLPDFEHAIRKAVVA
ncbi:MAG TPA: serine hydrolase domain-containing protein [Caulobacteraceae bacterium]|nr:serine hydrolase domain-containing protein [Caulobacteraceae bacterium]